MLLRCTSTNPYPARMQTSSDTGRRAAPAFAHACDEGLVEGSLCMGHATVEGEGLMNCQMHEQLE